MNILIDFHYIYCSFFIGLGISSVKNRERDIELATLNCPYAEMDPLSMMQKCLNMYQVYTNSFYRVICCLCFFYGCAKIDRVGSFQMNPTLSCHITMSQFYRYCKFSKNDFI